MSEKVREQPLPGGQNEGIWEIRGHNMKQWSKGFKMMYHMSGWEKVRKLPPGVNARNLPLFEIFIFNK